MPFSQGLGSNLLLHHVQNIGLAGTQLQVWMFCVTGNVEHESVEG